jgi:hypothetical protein
MQEVMKSKARLRFAQSQGVRDLHLVQLLNQIGIGYTPQGIIADQLFPVVQVDKQRDAYAVFSRKEALSTEDSTRAPGTHAKKITRSVSSGTYFAKNYALKADLTLEDRVNMDAVYAAQLVGGRARYLLNKLNLGWDVRAANLCNSTSNVGSSATVSSAWSGAGAPLTNLWTAIDNVRYATGYRPNKVTFGTKAWDSFSRDTTVRNLIFGTNNGGGYPTLEQVARIFQIERALIAGALTNTANEAQPQTLSTVWPDNVLVAFIAPNPTLDDPSFGYTFRWAAPGMPNLNIEIHPYDEKTKSDEIECGYYQDEVITASEYGFLIRAVNSSQ